MSCGKAIMDSTERNLQRFHMQLLLHSPNSEDGVKNDIQDKNLFIPSFIIYKFENPLTD